MITHRASQWKNLLKITLKQRITKKKKQKRIVGKIPEQHAPKKKLKSFEFFLKHQGQLHSSVKNKEYGTVYYDKCVHQDTNLCKPPSSGTLLVDHHHGNSSGISVSWLTLVITFVLAFVFYQISDPFRRRVLELDNDSPRQQSSIYFYVNAVLYGWLLSSIALTLIPQFSDHCNEIIAAALFFPMLFASIGAILLGRGLSRLVHLLILQGRQVISVSSHIPKATPFRRNYSDSSTMHCNEAWGIWWMGPARTPFFRPFRKIFKQALCVTVLLCFLYADCWSRDLGAFQLHENGGGAVCTAIFTPFSKFPFLTVHSKQSITRERITQGVEENTIWIIWLILTSFIITFYVQDEFSGRHFLRAKNCEFSVEKEISIDLGNLASTETGKAIQRTSSFVKYDDTDESDSESLSWIEGHDPSLLGDDDISESKSYDHNQINIYVRIQSSFRNIFGKKCQIIERPLNTLSMVPWYSVLLFETLFDIFVQITVFVGRFDARSLRPALPKLLAKDITSDNIRKSTNGALFDYRDKKDGDDGFWFDWVADCGDGFNSSYQVARMLAQPSLQAMNGSSKKTILPRGQILVIGGDLCYPGPSEFNFENRFFRTFEDALPPPPSFRKSAISISKPNLSMKGWCDKLCFTKHKDRDLTSYCGPTAFLIPGNHDWYDGLASYTRFILERDWLGGWLMPQQQSYFAIALPKGWWIFGLDHGLTTDIDIDQFKFFAEIAAKLVKPSDSVIVVNHEPAWIIEADEGSQGNRHEKKVRELLDHHLSGKVRLRIAGDLHHYTRHTPIKIKNSSTLTDVSRRPLSLLRSTQDHNQNAIHVNIECEIEQPPELIVSGGGGAFLHGTHTFSNRIKVAQKQNYERASAYPSDLVSRRIAWLNIWQFRWRNWRLDAVWAVGYFCISSSIFPLCGVYADYFNSKSEGPLDSILWLLKMLLSLLQEVFTTGRLSLVFSILILTVLYYITDNHFRPIPRALWGLGHGMLHCCAALSCLLFIELLIEYSIVNHILSVDLPMKGIIEDGMSLHDTLYEEYTKHFASVFHNSLNGDNPLGSFKEWNLIRITRRIPLLQTTLSLFDLPGNIAQQHVDICTELDSEDIPMIYGGLIPIDRLTIMLYLASVGLYFVVLSIPLAGSIFGTWLALSLNLLNGQYNGGFSSLRIQHWKNFLRLHIKDNGDLEVFSIGLDRVPKIWKLDERWSGSNNELRTRKKARKQYDDVPTWQWDRPSKWVPDRKTLKHTPRIVDYTCIPKR